MDNFRILFHFIYATKPFLRKSDKLEYLRFKDIFKEGVETNKSHL